MSMEQFVRSYNKASNTAAHKAGRAAGQDAYDREMIGSIAKEIKNQRQGIKGKEDASKLPSYAREYEQLDPGSEEARPYDNAVWDKHFAATRSSNVQEIFYSSERQVLRAVFLPRDGNPAAQYLYTQVPFQVFNRLQYMERSGGSVGSEFWKLIRIKPLAHRYNYRKIVGEGAYGTGRIRKRKGKMAKYGMPKELDAPIYAAHTRQQMKRAEARSSRTQAGTGGQSARAKKIAGGRR